MHCYLSVWLASFHYLDNIFSLSAGMKYDLRKVEEVYYDVKIRGLTPNGESVADQGIKGQSQSMSDQIDLVFCWLRYKLMYKPIYLQLFLIVDERKEMLIPILYYSVNILFQSLCENLELCISFSLDVKYSTLKFINACVFFFNSIHASKFFFLG